ncbi:MAG: hypothetical protein NTX19_04075 [Gemmatimonadetes bacterium]|nr:hypothetical protein [Gemmatimonadota bacterium]
MSNNEDEYFIKLDAERDLLRKVKLRKVKESRFGHFFNDLLSALPGRT